MLKNVRIWFTKEFECKYISHLDLNRCMLRAVRRAELPIWYTEGFNPHPFVTFPLPISLGISAKRECMDIRIVDDDFEISQIPELMNPLLPRGIQVFDATTPKTDAKFITFAEYEATISVDGMTATELRESVSALCELECVTIKKKSKKGMKDVDVLPYIKAMDFDKSDSENCRLSVILPAGNTKNVALPLVFKAIENHINKEINYDIVKLNMYTEGMEEFE
ncbi:MAG: DUF2344 domain-containing protein [Clostridia bacterium]|nr:DUF2344 domain-containing protein [Clostridia bacterium]